MTTLNETIPRSLLSRYSAASNNLWILISCTPVVILLELTIRVGSDTVSDWAELLLRRQADIDILGINIAVYNLRLVKIKMLLYLLVVKIEYLAKKYAAN